MKSLHKFAAENNLQVKQIRYRHQFGYCKRKGFDLVKDNFIVISFEPCDYSNGDKWLIRNKPKGFIGDMWISRITTKFLNTYLLPVKDNYKGNNIFNND
jgi:hypothetical protein